MITAGDLKMVSRKVFWELINQKFSVSLLKKA